MARTASLMYVAIKGLIARVMGLGIMSLIIQAASSDCFPCSLSFSRAERERSLSVKAISKSLMHVFSCPVDVTYQAKAQ